MARGSPPFDCRLLVDPPGDGAWNMAVDDWLAETVAAPTHERCALRFYRWARPTLSLGYFQSVSRDAGAAQATGLEIVRRASGGGAILHDRELTYSFAVALDHPLAADAETLYRRFHTTLVAVLAGYGVSAALCGQRDVRSPSEQPFLCFERRAGGDVVLGEHKIGGSAQRRQRNAILQHGSVLLEASPQAPNVLGLRDLTDKPFDVERLMVDWEAELAAALNLYAVARPLDEIERKVVGEIEQARYRSDAWTFAR